eukprot:TRINITY_DN4740_c0_g1_i3.p1 TRINITY_DN4740_c0_g1~~TRINITY_DN4740_c0_g1_i3.p1  ORF type:complete len:339 (+),score=60.11 TRINITY_DN4740_c0_g1_i3:103-1119(+)
MENITTEPTSKRLFTRMLSVKTSVTDFLTEQKEKLQAKIEQVEKPMALTNLSTSLLKSKEFLKEKVEVAYNYSKEVPNLIYKRPKTIEQPLSVTMKEFLQHLKSPTASHLYRYLTDFVNEYNLLEDLNYPIHDLPLNLLQEQFSNTKPKLRKSDLIQKSSEISEEIKRINQIQKSRGEMVQNFISSSLDKFLENPIWKNIKDREAETTALRECIERFIMVKIFPKAFLFNKSLDWNFSQLVSTLQFITPSHLDIPFPIEEQLVEACGEALHQMNFYKTPRNKLVCISNCCKLIFSEIQRIKSGTSETLEYSSESESSSVTTDEFLPVLCVDTLSLIHI